MWRRSFILILLLITVLVCSSFTPYALAIYRLAYKPMPLKEAFSIVEVDKHTSAYSFAHLLKTKHLIDSEYYLLLIMRLQGLTQQLQAGIYQIKPGESALHFLYRVKAGDVLVEVFRIIEGTTQAQISSKLEHAPFLTYTAADWLTILDGHANAEGLLLANTYYYNAGSDSKLLLKRAHANLQQVLQQSWQQRNPGLPYQSAYELLIAASIVEKEASLAQEKRLIAGILVNRLKKRMMLQMDPTVIYALANHYQGKLTHQDLQMDSPYNSYRNRGLPPTPIAMVGKEAIDAAAHPMSSNYLYYVARGDGSHIFSETYEQQRQAIARYLRNTDGKH